MIDFDQRTTYKPENVVAYSPKVMVCLDLDIWIALSVSSEKGLQYGDLAFRLLA